MGYVLFAISAYILMRALEVLFAEQKSKGWCRWLMRIIACAVLYAAVAAMLGFYVDGAHLLGFDPK